MITWFQWLALCAAVGAFTVLAVVLAWWIGLWMLAVVIPIVVLGMGSVLTRA